LKYVDIDICEVFGKKKMKSERGFTLLEVMITVAIIGILAAVAYPAYLDQMRKARRAQAQATLLNIAARQQQMLLDTRSYAASTDALHVTVPDTVLQTYTLSLTVGTATVPTFTALATPVGAQALDSCGAMSIDQTGSKSPASCW
jgi:type IV pilus assembly protein PilE